MRSVLPIPQVRFHLEPAIPDICCLAPPTSGGGSFLELPSPFLFQTFKKKRPFFFLSLSRAHVSANQIAGFIFQSGRQWHAQCVCELMSRAHSTSNRGSIVDCSLFAFDLGPVCAFTNCFSKQTIQLVALGQRNIVRYDDQQRKRFFFS